jgi:predicted NBD/HSP70 family sugar kinase
MDKKTFIRAVDIGGAGFRRIDIEQKLVTAGTIEASDIKDQKIKEPQKPISDLDSLMDFIMEDFELDKFTGIAYSVAGVIENYNLVVSSPNAHILDGVQLAKLTENKTKLKSAVFNDMEAAITGMGVLLPEEPYFMGITWSSGIGLRVWKDGEIVSVAEGGHTLLDPSPFAPLCGCGKRGHIEAIVGGQAIKRRVLAEIEALSIKKPEGVHPCKFLDDSYKNKQLWAVNLYKMVCKGMGIFLGNIQSLLGLPLIVWKGTFASQAIWELGLEDEIRSAMKDILIDSSWAEKDHLRFEFTPGENNKDALIGATKAFLSLAR